jgi:hypothetical protein
MICKTFGVLPNDPLLRKLTPIQFIWIYNNLISDIEDQRDAFDGHKKKTISSDGVRKSDLESLLGDMNG